MGGGPDATDGVAVAGGVGVGAVAGGVGVGVIGGVEMIEADRWMISPVQAVRKSNRDRTPAPASRMFARGWCAFKLAEFDKNDLMAAILIA